MLPEQRLKLLHQAAVGQVFQRLARCGEKGGAVFRPFLAGSSVCHLTDLFRVGGHARGVTRIVARQKPSQRRIGLLGFLLLTLRGEKPAEAARTGVQALPKLLHLLAVRRGELLAVIGDRRELVVPHDVGDKLLRPAQGSGAVSAVQHLVAHERVERAAAQHGLRAFFRVGAAGLGQAQQRLLLLLDLVELPEQLLGVARAERKRHIKPSFLFSSPIIAESPTDCNRGKRGKAPQRNVKYCLCRLLLCFISFGSCLFLSFYQKRLKFILKSLKFVV